MLNKLFEKGNQSNRKFFTQKFIFWHSESGKINRLWIGHVVKEMTIFADNLYKILHSQKMLYIWSKIEIKIHMAYLNGEHLNIEDNYGQFRSQGRKNVHRKGWLKCVQRGGNISLILLCLRTNGK